MLPRESRAMAIATESCSLNSHSPNCHFFRFSNFSVCFPFFRRLLFFCSFLRFWHLRCAHTPDSLQHHWYVRIRCNCEVAKIVGYWIGIVEEDIPLKCSTRTTLNPINAVFIGEQRRWLTQSTSHPNDGTTYTNTHTHIKPSKWWRKWRTCIDSFELLPVTRHRWLLSRDNGKV